MSYDLVLLTTTRPRDADLSRFGGGAIALAEGSLDTGGGLLTAPGGVAFEVNGPIEVDEDDLRDSAELRAAYRQGARWWLELSAPAYTEDLGGFDLLRQFAGRLILALGGAVHEPE